MAASTKPLLLLYLLLPLIFTQISSLPSSSAGKDGAFASEADEFKSRISSLESIIKERIQELGSKEESIQNLKTIIQEKSDTIESLQSEIDYLKTKGSSSARKRKGAAHEQVYELEQQIFRLQREIDLQNKRKVEMETRADVAEKKVVELSSKLENLTKVMDEQRKRFHEAQSSLKAAQKQILKAKLEAASTSKTLVDVLGEFLPHALAVHISEAQAYIVTHWNEHMRPAMDAALQKVMEKKDKVKRWSEPHMETLNIKWIPTIKETWLTFTTYLEPRVQSLAIKSIEVCHEVKQSLTQYVVKASKVADDYFQVAKKHADPFISQVVTVTKPHFDKVNVVLEPYTKKLCPAYKKFVKSATMYHQQAQELLKNNKLTRPVATMELAWFAATALLSLPVIFIINFLTAVLSTRPGKHYRRPINVQRRAKRRYHDK